MFQVLLRPVLLLFHAYFFGFERQKKVEKVGSGRNQKAPEPTFFHFFLQDLFFSTFRLAAVLDEERAHRRVAGLPFRLPDGLHE